MEFRKKSWVFIVMVFFGIALFLLIQKSSISNKIDDTRISIYTSFYPLAEFAQKIGGDKVVVTNLTPTGVEPHDYEPNPRDIARLYDSQIFIYNGVNLETWVDKIIPELESSGVTVVKASSGVEIINNDPHIWIDPNRAINIIKNVELSLINVDPVNKEYYSQNAEMVISSLNALDETYQTSLSNCLKQDIVSNHNVFGYISDRYGFKNISITGLSPDEDPSSQKLAEIVDYVKKNNIKYLLIEPLSSPRFADTISIETKLNILPFNPIEGLTPNQFSSGEDYFSIQSQNIINLAKALECQAQ